MNHTDLVKRAERWLVKSKGCSFAFTELVTRAYETPDAIGWRDGRAVLVECKATRNDFLSDKRKWFRKEPSNGMGAFRFYMCPHSIIQPEEVPDKWGLVWAWESGSIKQVRGPRGNAFNPANSPEFYFEDRNEQSETLMLVSALRRLYLRGDLAKIYLSPFKPQGDACFTVQCAYHNKNKHRQQNNKCMLLNITDIQECPARKLLKSKEAA